ncbi:MAG: protein kinase [Anaerolineae bacterium]|nr:protein kinase [Anaerolineae bacterium]
MTGDPLIGQQLDEYLLEELLGQGGMARVYRALDVRLNRYVAIKVMGTGYRSDSDYARRFDLEAQAIARLTHPNIVHLYRYGRAGDDMLYMAMQYIAGLDLGALLQAYREEGEFMPLEDARRVIGQVCSALDYAHSQGVIHRDVKPANIVLDRQGDAHLTDFGLVLLTEVGTRGEIFGTPYYIAPEQAISSASAAPQSDLYSIGVILYEMFTGVLPFDADDPLEVAMLHMTETPRSPRELRSEITPGLEKVILRALEKEPKERYPTGAQLSLALDEALQAKKAAQMRTSRKTLYSRVVAATEFLPSPPGAQTQPKASPEAASATRPKAAPATRPEAASATRPKAAPATQPEAALPTKPRTARRARPKTEPRLYLPEVDIPAPPPVGPAKPVGSAPPSAMPAPPLAAIPEPSPHPAPVPARVQPELPGKPARPSWFIPAAIGGGVLVILLCLVFLGRSWLRGRAPDEATATPSATANAVASQPTATPDDALATPVAAAPAATQVTAAPAASPTAETSSVPPAPVQLLIAWGKEESVWIVNQGGGDFVLAPLLLKSGEDSVAGDVWGVATLKPGECVVIIQGKEPKDAPQKCVKVGDPWKFKTTKKNLFGRPSIEVFYENERVRECQEREKACECDIVSSAP